MMMGHVGRNPRQRRQPHRRGAVGVGFLVGAATTNNNGGNTYNYYGVQADMQYAYTRAVAGAY